VDRAKATGESDTDRFTTKEVGLTKTIALLLWEGQIIGSGVLSAIGVALSNLGSLVIVLKSTSWERSSLIPPTRAGRAYSVYLIALHGHQDLGWSLHEKLGYAPRSGKYLGEVGQV